MKTIILMLLLAAWTTEARIVTHILEGSTNAGVRLTNTLAIAEGEAAELLTFITSSGYMVVLKDEASAMLLGSDMPKPPVVVAGPASIQIILSEPVINYETAHPSRMFCTWRITGSAYPEGQTTVIPQGDSSRVYLETSTNLIHWAPTCSLAVSNAVSQQFFRIRAER